MRKICESLDTPRRFFRASMILRSSASSRTPANPLFGLLGMEAIYRPRGRL